MNEIIGLRLPDFLYEAVAEEARASGNSLQAIIRLHLAEHYGYTGDKEPVVQQNGEAEVETQ